MRLGISITTVVKSRLEPGHGHYGRCASSTAAHLSVPLRLLSARQRSLRPSAGCPSCRPGCATKGHSISLSRTGMLAQSTGRNRLRLCENSRGRKIAPLIRNITCTRIASNRKLPWKNKTRPPSARSKNSGESFYTASASCGHARS